MKSLTMREEIEKRKLVAILTIGDTQAAVPVAKALYEGGVSAVEITLRTPRAFECIRLVRKEVPEMLVGAGTILAEDQVAKAKDAGAHFGVSLGANPALVKAADKAGLFFVPGVFTPTEIESAISAGCTLLKYFPISSLGMGHLRAMAAPYKHLGVKFIASGGISCANLREIAADPMIAAVGGSWLATPEQIELIHTGKITAQATAASALVRRA